MSIRDRLEDARILTSAGRQQGAFIQVLIAAAATSRKRYPRSEWDDSESFRNFVYDEMGVITGGPKYEVAFPFQGRQAPLEGILYYHFRCQLLHEATMPEDIFFTDPLTEDGKTYNVIHLGTPLGFPVGWVQRLATAVWLATENDDLWQDELGIREEAREQLGDLKHDVSFCRRPDQKSRKIKNKNEKMSWIVDGINLALSYSPSVTSSKLSVIFEQKAKSIRDSEQSSARYTSVIRRFLDFLADFLRKIRGAR